MYRDTIVNRNGRTRYDASETSIDRREMPSRPRRLGPMRFVPSHLNSCTHHFPMISRFAKSFITIFFALVSGLSLHLSLLEHDSCSFCQQHQHSSTHLPAHTSTHILATTLVKVAAHRIYMPLLIPQGLCQCKEVSLCRSQGMRLPSRYSEILLKAFIHSPQSRTRSCNLETAVCIRSYFKNFR